MTAYKIAYFDKLVANLREANTENNPLLCQRKVLWEVSDFLVDVDDRMAAERLLAPLRDLVHRLDKEIRNQGNQTPPATVFFRLTVLAAIDILVVEYNFSTPEARRRVAKDALLEPGAPEERIEEKAQVLKSWSKKKSKSTKSKSGWMTEELSSRLDNHKKILRLTGDYSQPEAIAGLMDIVREARDESERNTIPPR